MCVGEGGGERETERERKCEKIEGLCEPMTEREREILCKHICLCVRTKVNGQRSIMKESIRFSSQYFIK